MTTQLYASRARDEPFTAEIAESVDQSRVTPSAQASRTPLLRIKSVAPGVNSPGVLGDLGDLGGEELFSCSASQRRHLVYDNICSSNHPIKK